MLDTVNMIPVRCFTCNRVIGHKWALYKELVTKYQTTQITDMQVRCRALDEIGLNLYCCRRMILSHVEIIDNLLLYSNNPGEETAPNYGEPSTDCSDVKFLDAVTTV